MGKRCSFSPFTTLKTNFIPNTIHSIVRIPLYKSNPAPPPSSAHPGALLVHALYARSSVYTYINAVAYPRSVVLPLPGGRGPVVPTTPIFDSTAEGKEPGVALQLKGKEINDLGIIALERAPAAGWIACTTDAVFLMKPQYYDLVIDVTF